MNSDKTSETTPSTDTSKDAHEAGQSDRQPLATSNRDSSGSHEMERGTSLPDRSEANTDSGDTGFHTPGSNPGGRADGGGKGKDWFGLSFEAAQERMNELNKRSGEQH